MRKKTILTVALVLILTGFQTSFISAAGNYEDNMQVALKFRHEARFDEAINIYNLIISENPNDVDALVGRGFCYLQNKDLYERAKADFQKVVKETPTYIDAYYGLALIDKRTGKWKEAKKILQQAKYHAAGDQRSTDYLADIAWRIGHIQLARSIDSIPAYERVKNLKGFTNEIYLDYIHDWVEDRPDWKQAGITYIHHFRPDMTGGLSFNTYERNEIDDQQIGLTFAYRYNMEISLEYQSYFSTEQNFLARQKHHPTLYYSIPSLTVIGLGLRLDEYESGWAETGKFEIKQYFDSFYGAYTLHIGEDNFNRFVATQIAKIGYEHEKKLLCHIGYSYGDETIDTSGGSNFSDQLVEAIFLGLRYFVSQKWGIILAGGPEYRDSKLYRTTGSFSVFFNF